MAVAVSVSAWAKTDQTGVTMFMKTFSNKEAEKIPLYTSFSKSWEGNEHMRTHTSFTHFHADNTGSGMWGVAASTEKKHLKHYQRP